MTLCRKKIKNHLSILQLEEPMAVYGLIILKTLLTGPNLTLNHPKVQTLIH
jgi:hypothetical protein